MSINNVFLRALQRYEETGKITGVSAYQKKKIQEYVAAGGTSETYVASNGSMEAGAKTGGKSTKETKEAEKVWKPSSDYKTSHLDRKGANAAVNAKFGEAGYTERQKDAMSEYMMYSDDMNAGLRGLDYGYEDKKVMTAFRSSMEKLDEDESLYRGVDGRVLGLTGNETEEELRKKLVGKSYKDKGFLSTSLSEDVAKEFSARGAFDEMESGAPTVLVIDAKGTKGTYINSGLAEVVLDKDTTLHYTDVVKKDGVTYVYATTDKNRAQVSKASVLPGGIGGQNDQEVKDLEEKLRKVYLQAQTDVQAKMEDYLARFATKDAIKQEQVKRGEITQEEYLEWRKGQIAVGKQWQDKVDALAADYTNANEIAMGMVRGDMAGTFATNHNYAAYQLEHDTSLNLSFSLYDKHTLKTLVAQDPDLLPLPSVDIPKDLRWNRQKINSVVTQAVLQGDSIPKIAQSLRKVTDMNYSAAVRNARTSMTAAQNAGRVESYKHAQDMGIELEQEWLATLDGRTRHSHRQMDGERIPVTGDSAHPAKFSNGCRYPGDPQGPAWEIYNCRCTLVAALKDVDQSNAPRNSKLGDMSYGEWKNAHKTTSTQETAAFQ